LVAKQLFHLLDVSPPWQEVLRINPFHSANKLSPHVEQYDPDWKQLAKCFLASRLFVSAISQADYLLS
jgi:hypothetical protein